MGGAVHPRLAHQNAPTPGTGRALLAVGHQGVGKISTLSIDIHILLVKRGSPLSERFHQDLFNVVNQEGKSFLRQPIRGISIMQLRGPQCLIGINIADATDHPPGPAAPF